MYVCMYVRIFIIAKLIQCQIKQIFVSEIKKVWASETTGCVLLKCQSVCYAAKGMQNILIPSWIIINIK